VRAESGSTPADTSGATPYRVQRSPGRIAFVIANPGDRVGDEHPYARDLGA
jgi:hypothetical protein